MKIAYVGNRKNKASDNKSFNTEEHVAKSLEKLGHAVQFIQEDEFEPYTLADLVAGSDLFLWTRTWPGRVTEFDLAEIEKQNIPTVSFHLDKYAGIKRDGGLGEDVFWKTQHVFSPEGSVQSKKIFKSHGINQHYLPPGVFADECYMAEPVDHFKHDVVFVGGGETYSHPEWPYRAKLVKWLKETYGDRLGKYGHPERTVRGEELNQLYASCKVVIGDTLCKDFMDSFYYSDRQFEVTGRGGFLITPYIAGITDHFRDREEAVFYAFDNFVQLKNLIDYYLEHDDEREAIRRAGHERTKRENTYTQRMQQMLDIIFPAGALPTRAPAPSRHLKISLGAGTEPEEGFVNVDIVDMPGINVVHNLMQYPWPFEDGSADYIKAKDIIEHMATHLSDGRSSIIAFLEECHRILRPGGTLWIQTPSWEADFLWIDPTHVRGFDKRSFDFFDPETDFGRATGFYSKAKFKVQGEESENHNLKFTMVKQ